jgi:hypothetical protein
LPVDTLVPIEQVMLDALLEVPMPRPIEAPTLRLQVDRLGLHVRTALRFAGADGRVRAWDLHGDPGPLATDPTRLQVAQRFAASGVDHVLGGLDHLLFILCLLVPMRRLRPLIVVVTAFTIAHTITLIGSAYGLAPSAPWFPPLVEWLIALSIVWMAIEMRWAPAASRIDGGSPSASGSCTDSASRSGCARPCSSRATICWPRCWRSMSASSAGR